MGHDCIHDARVSKTCYTIVACVCMTQHECPHDAKLLYTMVARLAKLLYTIVARLYWAIVARLY